MSGTAEPAFIREVVCSPAFDRRHTDPRKNYGIHGMELAFYLTGPRGTIQFVIYTNWMLPHVQMEMDARSTHQSSTPYLFHKPIAADIGYHSRTPRYAEQTALTHDCQFTGGDCYYGGSGLNAEKVYEVMVAGGTTALWAELALWYERYLGEREQ